MGCVTLAAFDFVSTTATSFDVASQTVNTTSGNGQGISSYDGAAFISFSFDLAQDPARIGFINSCVTVETAIAALPLPVGLPLLLAGLGALGVAKHNVLAKAEVSKLSLFREAIDSRSYNKRPSFRF